MTQTPQRYVALTLLVILASSAPNPCSAFGPTGHRVVGQIAENHLSPAAAKAVKSLLGTELLAEVSTWPDEIRSDKKWDHTSTWHYATIEDGETYETSKKNPKGDVVQSIRRFISTLENDKATKEEKVIALKWLVHLVGDVHQPLHLGRGADRGGNDIEAKWFGQTTNIHAVWDSKMIDSTKLSFTELTRFIDKATPEQVAKWQGSHVLDWVQESVEHRQQAYKVPEPTTSGSYKYSYKNLPLVKQRLLQAGVRLAGQLNNIYADPR